MRLISSIIGSGRSAGSTLNTGITAFWQLGSTADTVGANTLTNNSSVSFANDGPVAGLKCATFSGSNWLSIADNAALSNNTSTTIAGWFYEPDIANNFEVWVSKWPVDNEYLAYHDGVNIKGNIATSVDAAAGTGALSNNTWYNFIFVFDAVAQTVQIWINNFYTNGALSYTGGLTDGGSNVGIGAMSDGTLPMTGRLYGIGFWKKAFTPAENIEFYNGGVAKIYPF